MRTAHYRPTTVPRAVHSDRGPVPTDNYNTLADILTENFECTGRSRAR